MDHKLIDGKKKTWIDIRASFIFEIEGISWFFKEEFSFKIFSAKVKLEIEDIQK